MFFKVASRQRGDSYSISRFWFEKTKVIAANHLIDASEILKNKFTSADRQLRSMAVRKLRPLEIECVVEVVGGSGWASYQKSRSVCGIQLPEVSIWLATTSQSFDKAQEGHDMPVTEEEARDIVGNGFSNK